jgi:hypothetical protein
MTIIPDPSFEYHIETSQPAVSFTAALIRDAGPKAFTYRSARTALDASPSGIVVSIHRLDDRPTLHWPYDGLRWSKGETWVQLRRDDRAVWEIPYTQISSIVYRTRDEWDEFDATRQAQ